MKKSNIKRNVFEINYSLCKYKNEEKEEDENDKEDGVKCFGEWCRWTNGGKEQKDKHNEKKRGK